jgi:hypothetical protein
MEASYAADADVYSTFSAWVPVPEAVENLLRRWSTPASRPIEVTWDCQPWRPRWLLPASGWLPGHRGNVDEHQQEPSVDLNEAWQANARAHETRFAAMMEQVRAQWLDGQSVADFLDQAAAHLNASQPPAPELLIDAYVASDDDLLSLGKSVTAGWIDPVAVAYVGTRTWNDFASHRPGTVPAMANAMLSGSLHQALQVWNMCEDPICVYRIPGPAGPLYERGVNGTHRLHAARLLNMPAIWAKITQDALPLQITPNGLRVWRGEEPEQLVTCWRGLLAIGLAHGTVEDSTFSPRLSILHLDDVVAPWLLIQPKHAVAWAAVYNRAYPGALEDCGIPPWAWQSSQAWLSWLATAGG